MGYLFMGEMMRDEDFEYADPNAGSLMQSLRAFGYDISTAIADLIDNSITAKASEVSIVFEWNEGKPWISIFDNGYGMDENELFEAMKPGSKNPLDERDSNDLGRFGLGLKTASFSQCKRLTVASKKKDGDICVRCWDLDLVTEKNRWILLKVVPEYSQRIIDNVFINKESGTLVIWDKLDRIIPGAYVDDIEYQNAFLSYAKSVKDHISIVFSSYMHGANKVRFTLNQREISMWDPFMIDNSYTTKMPTETLYIDGYEVVIKPYILPHQSRLSLEEFSENAGMHGWNEQQGFYIFRNNRLIVSSDWLIDGLEKSEQYRLARIRIDIGNETDSEWNIDVRKSTAVPPVSIRKEVKRIALAARKESSKIYRHRGKKLARKGKKEKFYVWHQSIRRGKIGYEINREHPLINSLLNSDKKDEIKQMLDLIEETIPVPMIISDYSEKSEEMLEPYEGKNTDEFDKMIKKLFDVYIGLGCSPQEAVERIASTEPFIYAPEMISLFCEKEGLNFE